MEHRDLYFMGRIFKVPSHYSQTCDAIRSRDDYNELVKLHLQRTEKHIEFVCSYSRPYATVCKFHDSDKTLRDMPIFAPYVLRTATSPNASAIARELKPREVSTDELEAMEWAIFMHIKGNRHHPEYWDAACDFSKYFEKKPVDASAMPETDLLEMCADWCAMAKELGTNTPVEWFENNLGRRWQFSQEQQDVIRKILVDMWNDGK